MRVTYVKRPPGHGFFSADHEVLSRDHEVTELFYPGRPTPSFVRACWRAAGQSDALYTIFASEHALVAGLIFRARRRRVVIAVGGYDTANDRIHCYGLGATHRGWVPALATRLAHRLIAHSPFALEELLEGNPRLAPKAAAAYLAVDLERWPDPAVTRDVRQVTTIATVSRESFYRKGIDRFLAAARQDPDRPYVLAGSVLPDATALVHDQLAPNVRLTGPLPLAELNRLLWSTGAYVQLSWHETFGMAMAEAMACGCTPVVSDQPALVDVAGSWSVRPGAAEADDALIARGAAAEIDRIAMRADVGRRFDPELRRTALLAALG